MPWQIGSNTLPSPRSRIQHQLPWNLVVDASYVGSRSDNLNTNNNQAGAARVKGLPFRSSVLLNPWRPQWDMSLNKRFNFQFRLEAFNVFNTPILGGPDTNPNNLNFGFVAANQGNFPRNVQLGFKFNF